MTAFQSAPVRRINRINELCNTAIERWLYSVKPRGYYAFTCLNLIFTSEAIETESLRYEGRSESKELFAIQRYLLIIEKKQNMQVLITHLHLLLHIVTLDIEVLVSWHQLTNSLFVPDGRLAIEPFHDSMLHDAFHWGTSDHPAYSPDLASSEFYLFSKMKEQPCW